MLMFCLFIYHLESGEMKGEDGGQDDPFRKTMLVSKNAPPLALRKGFPFQRLNGWKQNEELQRSIKRREHVAARCLCWGFLSRQVLQFLMQARSLETDRVSDTTVPHCADVMDVTKMTIVYDDMIFQPRASV